MLAISLALCISVFMCSFEVISGKSVRVSGLEVESNIDIWEFLPLTGVAIWGCPTLVSHEVGTSSTTSGVILPGLGVAVLG